MQKLKIWWASLSLWKKLLLAIPASIVVLLAFVAALWPQKRRSVVHLPPVTELTTKAAETVEVRVDQVIEGINKDIQIAKERAKDAQEEIREADSFDAVDDILYGRKTGKSD